MGAKSRKSDGRSALGGTLRQFSVDGRQRQEQHNVDHHHDYHLLEPTLLAKNIPLFELTETAAGLRIPVMDRSDDINLGHRPSGAFFAGAKFVRIFGGNFITYLVNPIPQQADVQPAAVKYDIGRVSKNILLLNERMLESSILFSLLSFSFSLATLREFYSTIVLSTSTVCLAHNITLFVLSHKEAKRGREERTETLPAMAKLVFIVITFILLLAWCAAIAILLPYLLYSSVDKVVFSRVLPGFECAFALCEAVVLLLLTVGCIVERRKITGGD
ncbi:hypothetical protein GALMADRAFT_210039 [Galerina marginata CBS 339.88]|uniref:Uncharacterized protein n=1 Tax=Galerina marginata (strain CBS 339.88) TaxID=685588 RepID=A0A067TD25_GALM3|nr:hypothetical protein GALMADRAFT_210039 [Galerina marginata CBS 339.88]